MASCGDLNLGGQYKKLQIDFVTWAANWVRNGLEPEPVSCDLPDVVNLLQALGFRIRNIDDKKTQTLSPLRGGENGSKVMVSCTYSGQTCILEQPTNMANCRCVTEPKPDTSDAIWEVTATTQQATQGLIETGCDIIPQMSKEQSSVVKHVVNYLVQMIRQKKFDSFTDINTTPIKFTGRRSEPYSSLLQNTTPKRSQLSITSKYDSPTRYRSLDTLTGKDADIGLPEPGSLRPKIILENPPITVSSPNLKLATSTDASYTSQSSASTADDTSITTKAVSLIRNASETLLKALNIIENQAKNARSVSPTTGFEDKVILASKNIKKLMCFKPPPSTSSLARQTSPTISTKSGLSLPKSRLRIKSDSYTLDVPQPIKSRVRKNSDEKPGIPKPEGVFRKTDKYAHVKSTIPKPTESNKKK